MGNAGTTIVMVILVGIVLYLGIVIMFLLSQSSFAKSMQTSNVMKNTSGVWIWTQLIPIWNLIAIPVTLIKLNEQCRVYLEENDLTGNVSLKQYNNTWGWVWFGGMIISFIFPIFGLISLVGLIGFWIHINGVKKSLIMQQNVITNNIEQ